MPEWSKGVDSSSTSLKTAWVRTPLQALCRNAWMPELV